MITRPQLKDGLSAKCRGHDAYIDTIESVQTLRGQSVGEAAKIHCPPLQRSRLGFTISFNTGVLGRTRFRTFQLLV